MARVRRRRRKWGTYFVHLSVILIVVIWTIPTFGILVSSFRDKDQLAVSGWWTALTTSEQNYRRPAAPPSSQTEDAGKYVISGNVLEGKGGDVTAFGVRIANPTEFKAGDTAPICPAAAAR